MTRRKEHKNTAKDPHQAFKYFVMLLLSLTFSFVVMNTNTLRVINLELDGRALANMEDGVIRPACKFERKTGKNEIYTCIF